MKKILIMSILAMTLIVSGCTVLYSFSGASIDPKIKTVTVSYFPNMATMVAPILSPTFTDDLQSKIQRETRLQLVREDGDISFSGEIVDYRSDPVSISGDEVAQQNRLTIAVKVKFINNIDPKWNFDKVFSDYVDYDSRQLLNSVEGALIPQVVEKIVEKVFNEALSNW